MAKQQWTFFTNYGHVLLYISGHSRKVLREVATDVGITERQVQKIVRELVEAGILVKKKSGRQNFYKVNGNVPLRHPLEEHRTVGELIQLIVGDEEPGT